jgi:hypothetical protein
MSDLTVKLTDDLVSRLRSHLARRGGELSQYVSEAIRRQLFWDTVEEVHEQNHNLTPEEAEKLAAEAVDWARATRP